MRRGFFSVATAALVVLALLAFIAGSLLLGHRARVTAGELEAKKVADTMSDGLLALNASLEDAVLDRTWTACGCNGTNETRMNSTFLLGNLSAYFNATLASLSSELVTVSLSNLSLTLYNPTSCNGTFILNASYRVLANGTSSRLLRTVSDLRTVTTFNSSTEFNVTFPRNATAAYTVRVFCA